MLLSALRRQWLVIVTVALVLSAAVLVWSASGPPKLHVAEARLAIVTDRRLPDELAPFLDPQAPEFDPAVIGSPTIPERAARILGRLRESAKEEDIRQLAKAIAATTRVERQGDRFIVRTSSADPQEAIKWADMYAMVTVELSRAQNDLALRKAIDLLEKKREEAGKSLEILELQRGTGESQGRDLERRIAAVNDAAAQIERQVEQIRARQDKTVARIRALEADEHRLRELLPTGSEEDGLRSPVLDRIRQEMNSIRADIALKNLERAPEGPEYRKASARLGELAEAWRNELHRVRGYTIVALRESLNDLDGELRTLDERRMRKSLELREMEDERKTGAPKRAELGDLRKETERLEELRGRAARALAAQSGTSVRVESGASEVPSERPSSGPWTAIGLLAAILIGVSAGMVRDRLDPRVRTDRDVKRYLNLPALALIGREEGDPFILRTPGSLSSEAFSMAATMLRSYLREHEFKTCVVTSAAPQEGKTSVAANLSVALARKGLNVALIDADLRSPRLHELFGVDNAAGLSTILLGGDVDPELTAGATEVPTLRLLPSGPVNELPAELMESQRMGDLLQALRDRYDVVIIDAPPVTGASDALTLARQADTCVWVIRSGASDRGRLGWTKHLLKNVSADFAGVVLTGAPSSVGERYTSYPAA